MVQLRRQKFAGKRGNPLEPLLAKKTVIDANGTKQKEIRRQT